MRDLESRGVKPSAPMVVEQPSVVNDEEHDGEYGEHPKAELRSQSRQSQQSQQPLNPASQPTTIPDSPTPSMPTTTSTSLATKRAALFHRRKTPKSSSPQPQSLTAATLHSEQSNEQSGLISEILSYSSSLRRSAQSFSSKLDSDKASIEKATLGIDQAGMGMESANRRIGNVRKESEGEGWFGRAFLYAYIAGLTVVCILLVFVGPKLRF